MGYFKAVLYALIVGIIGVSVGVLLGDFINPVDSINFFIIVGLFTVSGAAMGWKYGIVQ